MRLDDSKIVKEAGRAESTRKNANLIYEIPPQATLKFTPARGTYMTMFGIHTKAVVSEGPGNSEIHPIHPHKLAVSHADNHLLHLTTVSDLFLPIPSCCDGKPAPKCRYVSPTVASVVIDHNGDRSPPIHLVRDVGVLPGVVNGL